MGFTCSAKPGPRAPARHNTAPRSHGRSNVC